MSDENTQPCDECGSQFRIGSSRMKSLCPECSHLLYGYPRCDHDFIHGRCKKCHWDTSRSAFIEDFTPGRSSMIQFTPYAIPSTQCLDRMLNEERDRLGADEEIKVFFGGYLIADSLRTTLVHTQDWIEALCIWTNYRVILVFGSTDPLARETFDYTEVKGILVKRLLGSVNSYDVIIDSLGAKFQISTIANENKYSFPIDALDAATDAPLMFDQRAILASHSSMSKQGKSDASLRGAIISEQRKLCTLVSLGLSTAPVLYWGFGLKEDFKILLFVALAFLALPTMIAGIASPKLMHAFGKHSQNATMTDKLLSVFLMAVGLVLLGAFLLNHFS